MLPKGKIRRFVRGLLLNAEHIFYGLKSFLKYFWESVLIDDFSQKY